MVTETKINRITVYGVSSMYNYVERASIEMLLSPFVIKIRGQQNVAK
jgi:hypothetical protein